MDPQKRRSLILAYGKESCDWERAVELYKQKKLDGTLGELPVEHIAKAVSRLANENKKFGEVAGVFGEKGYWFTYIGSWIVMHPDAQKLFTLGRSLDRLSLVETKLVCENSYDLQPKRAANLVDMQKRRAERRAKKKGRDKRAA